MATDEDTANDATSGGEPAAVAPVASPAPEPPPLPPAPELAPEAAAVPSTAPAEVPAVEATAEASGEAAPAGGGGDEGSEAEGDAPAGEGSEAAADAPAEEGSEAAADAPAGEGAPGEGPPKKKRRRRRRKKKPAAEGAAPEGAAAEGAAAEGEAPEGGDEADGDEPDGGDALAGAPVSAAGESRPGPSHPGRKKDDRPRPKKKPKPLERPAFNVGDEVFGRVTKVTKDAIFLDIAGGKAAGVYDRELLIQVPPRTGEQFIAKVLSVSTRGGIMMLGREPWDLATSRAELRAALQTGNALPCWVTGIIKGGLEIDHKGVRAFAPASHVELRPGADLAPLLGEKLDFVVTTYAKKGRDIVLSRKQMLEGEAKQKRDAALATLAPESVVRGMVRTVLQWGVFVSLPDHGDIEGVIHMSEASHDRGSRMQELFTVGEEIPVKILRIDEKGKLWLSRKATIEDPWSKATEKYAPGTIHLGKVVRLTDFGAFVQLEPGIDGLCHVSDLSLAPVAHPNEVVKEGEDLEVLVAGIDGRNRKITLHPAPPADERDIGRVRLQTNQMVNVVVVKILEGGLGVRVIGATGRHARGFIPAGQTGTPRGTDLRKTFPIGKKLEAKIIELDPKRGECKLSIRALKEDAEKQAYREYRKKVQREASFGTFGDLLKGKI
jgi:small subunit ribosomal protein S1